MWSDAGGSMATARFRPSAPGSSADEGNVVMFGIAPHERVTLTMHPGNVLVTLQQPRRSRRRHDSTGRPDEDLSAYARVLDDARGADHRRFVQRDLIEATWRIFDGVLDADLPLQVYEQGSAGPAIEVREAQRAVETMPAP